MKGHFNKPICAIMTSLILILGSFAVVFPFQEAEADHKNVSVTIALMKNGGVHTSYGPFYFPCGVECDVSIDLPTRDKLRFDRWCDSNPLPLVVPANSQQLIKTICESKGPWDIRINIFVIDKIPPFPTGATHPTPITVNVEAT